MQRLLSSPVTTSSKSFGRSLTRLQTEDEMQNVWRKDRRRTKTWQTGSNIDRCPAFLQNPCRSEKRPGFLLLSLDKPEQPVIVGSDRGRLYAGDTDGSRDAAERRGGHWCRHTGAGADAPAGLLADAGIPCEILLQEEKFTPDGLYWFDRCAEKKIPVRMWADVTSLDGYGSIADCIFGTGFHGSAAGEAARMIRMINESGAYTVSADINSGLNGNNGMAETAVHSDLTVSIGSWKPGHFLNMAKDIMAEKVNIDIGIPPLGHGIQLTEEADAAELFPARKHFSHKGIYGYIALIGGSFRYSGAIRLAAMANAAMRSGAGVVRLCAPRSLCEKMIPDILEATLFPLAEDAGNMVFREEEFREALRGTKTAAFGMGAGMSGETEKTVRYLTENYEGTLILDADGLNALAAIGTERVKNAAGKVILTPHIGEFARLSGKTAAEIQNSPVALAEDFAGEHGVILLLKGPGTIVTDGKETWIADRGTPGMATAGSGDVLSGILAAVAAAHPDELLKAAAGAAWINGRAGETAAGKYGEAAMTAGDTAGSIAEVVRALETAERPVRK